MMPVNTCNQLPSHRSPVLLAVRISQHFTAQACKVKKKITSVHLNSPQFNILDILVIIYVLVVIYVLDILDIFEIIDTSIPEMLAHLKLLLMGF